MGWLGKSAAAIGCAILAACSFPADYTGTSFECDPAGGQDQCPPGFDCVSGVCQAEAAPSGGDDGGDDGEGDGGDGDGQVGPTGCPLASRFQDSFDDDDAWVIDHVPGCTALIQNGRIELRNTGGETVDCGARSRSEYELDVRTWIEAVDPGSGIFEAQFAVEIGTETILFLHDGDRLSLIAIGKSNDVSTDISFDPVLHRFWAITPDGNGGLLWETSPDAETWDQQGSYESDVSPAEECFRYDIGIAGRESATEVAQFDNLNRTNGSAGPSQ